MPTRSVDIPKIVYYVRRGRASTVKTREQYEFVYKVCTGSLGHVLKFLTFF